MENFLIQTGKLERWGEDYFRIDGDSDMTLDIIVDSSMRCLFPAWCLICCYMPKGSHHFLSLCWKEVLER